MWKVFSEMRQWGWIDAAAPLPRMIVAQAEGCAPIVRAFEQHADRATPWENPTTHASGLRVPGPLGDRLILRALAESGGDAIAVSEEEIRDAAGVLARVTGVDAAPEGGAALAAVRKLRERGRLGRDLEIVIFNTGSGASYRA
jgi:threonine synthase